MPNTPRTTRARSVSQQAQAQAGSSSSPIPTTRRSMPVVELPSSRSSAKNSKAASTPPQKPRSATSTPTTHHHKSADEIAIEEAEELLENVDVEHGDARSRRHEHLRLSRLRSLSVPAGPEIELGDEVSSEEAIKEEQESKVAESIGSGDRVDQDEVDDGPLASGASEATDIAGDKDEEKEIPLPEAVLESDDDSSEADSDSDDTSDTSDSDSDSDSDADSDEDDAELERLLQAAKVSATATASRKDGANVLGGDGDVVSFDTEDQQQEKREAPIPDIAITKMPKPHLSFSADGSARATDAPLIIAGPSRSKSSQASKIPELDARPYERTMSKREKAAQPRKATVSELWSTLPAPKADVLPQMRRDYQALSLANSLDPKRFMKGGNRSGKIPETFAIGTLVEAPRHLQDTTLTREKQYRPGQLVQSLTRDEDTGSYAKRKYGDLQSKRMENGRGNGWKKQRGWKP